MISFRNVSGEPFVCVIQFTSAWLEQTIFSSCPQYLQIRARYSYLDMSIISLKVKSLQDANIQRPYDQRSSRPLSFGSLAQQ